MQALCNLELGNYPRAVTPFGKRSTWGATAQKSHPCEVRPTIMLDSLLEPTTLCERVLKGVLRDLEVATRSERPRTGALPCSDRATLTFLGF